MNEKEQCECVMEEVTVNSIMRECEYECQATEECIKYNEGRRDAFAYIKHKLGMIKEQAVMDDIEAIRFGQRMFNNGYKEGREEVIAQMKSILTLRGATIQFVTRNGETMTLHSKNADWLINQLKEIE